MSELRIKTKMDFGFRDYSTKTMEYYIGNVMGFTQYFKKSPDLLGENEIEVIYKNMRITSLKDFTTWRQLEDDFYIFLFYT